MGVGQVVCVGEGGFLNEELRITNWELRIQNAEHRIQNSFHMYHVGELFIAAFDFEGVGVTAFGEFGDFEDVFLTAESVAVYGGEDIAVFESVAREQGDFFRVFGTDADDLAVFEKGWGFNAARISP